MTVNKKVLIAKPRTMRQVLNIIDTFLEEGAIKRMNSRRGGKQADALWSVLTALRSDDTREAVKHKTTGPVRAKAFPKFAVAGRSRGSHPDTKTRNPRLSSWTPVMGGVFAYDSRGTNPHFVAHLERAIDALRMRK